MLTMLADRATRTVPLRYTVVNTVVPMRTGGAQQRPWGYRFKRLLLDEYLDTHPDARGDHGFQAWLVRASGVKRSTIGTWWSSGKRPDLASLAKVRSALPGLTVTQMVAAIEGVEIDVKTAAADVAPMVDLAEQLLEQSDSAAAAAHHQASTRQRPRAARTLRDRRRVPAAGDAA